MTEIAEHVWEDDGGAIGIEWIGQDARDAATYDIVADPVGPFLTGSVYLAGPMSGYPEFNAPAFRRAAYSMRQAGWSVVSPVEMDVEDGFKHEDHPDADAAFLAEVEYNTFLRRDLARLLGNEQIQGVVVLPGWEASRGAAAEVEAARNVGLPIFAYPSMDPVKRPTDYRPASTETVMEEAIRLVGGDRGAQYGRPIHDFTRTAKIMTVILDDLLREGAEVPPEKVPLLMLAVKLSRIVQSPRKRDSVVDIGGYAQTYEMVMEDLGTPLR